MKADLTEPQIKALLSAIDDHALYLADNAGRQYADELKALRNAETKLVQALANVEVDRG